VNTDELIAFNPGEILAAGTRSFSPEVDVSALTFNVDAFLEEAARPPLPAEARAALRARNRAAAVLFLRAAARQGITSDDPATETLLAKFRRDALREAGVDERLIRRTA
jgi:hypothetical protein